MFIANIGILSAKKQGVQNTKKRSVLNAHIFAFYNGINWHLSFMKWTPGLKANTIRGQIHLSGHSVIEWLSITGPLFGFKYE